MSGLRAMRRARFTVSNEIGLHARPAAMLVQVAQRFTAQIVVECRQHRADAKSIMGIMTLAARRGDVLSVIIDGPDAGEAMKAIREVLARALNQGESVGAEGGAWPRPGAGAGLAGRLP